MTTAAAPIRSARLPGTWQAIERSEQIDAPPERVFDLISDLGRSPEWAGSGEVRAMERLDAAPIHAGSRWRSNQQVRGMKYHTVSTVQTYEPGRAFIWHVAPPNNTRSQWGFTLEPEAGGTRLTHFYDLDYAPNFPQRAITKFLYRLTGRGAEIGRHLEATLRNVKSLAESGRGGAA